jgi:hypothetical protein
MIAEQQIDTYLSSLRSQLGPMTLDDREEILRELGAHIRDAAEQPGVSVAEVLARLGPPKELAAQYCDGLLIRRASRSLSPLTLLRGSLRLAAKGASGIVVFFAGVFGYLIGGGMVLSGLLKPIFPRNTGMWFDDAGHMIASGTQWSAPQPPAHEVLGDWYIPIMITLGSLLILATMFLIRTTLRLSKTAQMRLR